MIQAHLLEAKLLQNARAAGWDQLDGILVKCRACLLYTSYIADGHHRAASAVKVGLKRREENPGYTGEEPFNYFLSVLFPDEQLMILPYNRVVKDLNGMDEAGFLAAVGEHFTVEKMDGPYAPDEKGLFGMYLGGSWYKLAAGAECRSYDPVKGLDVSILQDRLLGPVLGIGDPRTDKRIDFIGGIRGLGELERRVKEDMTVAFSMYPTSIKAVSYTHLDVYKRQGQGAVGPPHRGRNLCGGWAGVLLYLPPDHGRQGSDGHRGLLLHRRLCGRGD